MAPIPPVPEGMPDAEIKKWLAAWVKQQDNDNKNQLLAMGVPVLTSNSGSPARYGGSLGKVSSPEQNTPAKYESKKSADSTAFTAGYDFDAYLKELQRQTEAANTANEERYAGILSGFGDIEDLLAAQGKAARKDLATQYRQAISGAGQDLVSRGLTGTTIKPTVEMGYRRQHDKSVLDLYENLAMQKANLGLQQLGFMERRTDQAPNLLPFYEMAAQFGASQPVPQPAAPAPAPVQAAPIAPPSVQPQPAAPAPAPVQAQQPVYAEPTKGVSAALTSAGTNIQNIANYMDPNAYANMLRALNPGVDLNIAMTQAAQPSTINQMPRDALSYIQLGGQAQLSTLANQQIAPTSGVTTGAPTVPATITKPGQTGNPSKRPSTGNPYIDLLLGI